MVFAAPEFPFLQLLSATTTGTTIMFSMRPLSTADAILTVHTAWDLSLAIHQHAHPQVAGTQYVGVGVHLVSGGVGSRGCSTGDYSGRRASGQGSTCSPELAGFRHEIVRCLRVRVCVIRGWACIIASLHPLGCCDTHYLVTGTVTVVLVQEGEYSFRTTRRAPCGESGTLGQPERQVLLPANVAAGCRETSEGIPHLCSDRRYLSFQIKTTQGRRVLPILVQCSSLRPPRGDGMFAVFAWQLLSVGSNAHQMGGRAQLFLAIFLSSSYTKIQSGCCLPSWSVAVGRSTNPNLAI
jgi:hypothetical protein